MRKELINAFLDIGIQVYKDDETCKTTNELLSELCKKWKELNESTRFVFACELCLSKDSIVSDELVIVDSKTPGNLGKVLYIKFTVDEFKSRFKNPPNIKDEEIYSVKECDEKFTGLITSVPIHIDNNTLGNYEAICEFGREIH